MAAILFPVFATAKEAAKKTATMAQYKQVGTGTQIYITDYDDVYPLGMSPDTTNNGWRVNGLVAVPAGWTSTGIPARNTEPRKSEEAMMVNNSLYPYLKNIQLMAAQGLPRYDQGMVQAPNAPGPADMNLAYNGILHAWSATAVAQPSRLPLLSPTVMRQNIKGAILSSPTLDCVLSGNSVCKFTPGAFPAGAPGAMNGGAPYGYVWWLFGTINNFTLWQYGRGMTFVAADTSARFMNFNAPKWPQFAVNVNSSPWSSFDPNGPPGSPYWMTDCVSPGKVKGTEVFYPGYYRPDSEFNWTTTECDHGGG